MANPFVVIPRPGTHKSSEAPQIIPAPSEADFIAVFGTLLPAASYLQTSKGRIAYYQLPSSAPSRREDQSSMSRVLFVHGIQTPALGLQPLASTLASRFPTAQCVLVDLWGHGLTDTPVLPHEPALFHELIEAVMAEIGWGKAHFVGFSFGAATTVKLAAKKPELFESMVLIAPAGVIREAGLSDLDRSFVRGLESEERTQAWVVEYLEDGPLLVPGDWKERVDRGEVVALAVKDWSLKNHKGHRASVAGVIRDGGVFDTDAEFAKAAKTGIKSLCILGELDGLSTAKDFHNAGFQDVVVVPKAGHGVPRDRVPEVAQSIEEFWKKL
ncbi:putative valacyclovir hydrolase [Microthyrium microscopicum]|uniref:Putative valacyclovir hydrolase n=1 Tax=Microthyrium microscopicum TaxID=703497 RepID=A0A6A6TZS1_9PEZI|nr:putative valacyclovir hydrolase [Microthyrium microscopicum]